MGVYLKYVEMLFNPWKTMHNVKKKMGGRMLNSSTPS